MVILKEPLLGWQSNEGHLKSSWSHYSKSELCGGAVTVSFFEEPPLAGDPLLTMLHPLPENVNGVVMR
jgi:hypothetical protein